MELLAQYSSDLDSDSAAAAHLLPAPPLPAVPLALLAKFHIAPSVASSHMRLPKSWTTYCLVEWPLSRDQHVLVTAITDQIIHRFQQTGAPLLLLPWKHLATNRYNAQVPLHVLLSNNAVMPESPDQVVLQLRTLLRALSPATIHFVGTPRLLANETYSRFFLALPVSPSSVPGLQTLSSLFAAAVAAAGGQLEPYAPGFHVLVAFASPVPPFPTQQAVDAANTALAQWDPLAAAAQLRLEASTVSVLTGRSQTQVDIGVRLWM